jgi:5-methylcytosine-specific restriction endonuclease McrA
MVTPNSLDDLLALLPGLRRLRRLPAELLRILLDRRPGRCSWCGDAVGAGRRTFCGPACVDAFELRCSPVRQRTFVVNRDAGCCRLCGRDTLRAERDAEAAGLKTWVSRQRDESDYEYQARQKLNAAQLLTFGYARGRWREVDHDPPVVEGGGLADPASLRLLCGACHQDVTNQLTARRRTGPRDGKEPAGWLDRV